MGHSFLEEEEDQEGLMTTSRARMWLLTHFAGYRIAMVREAPRPNLLGRKGYRCIWRLEKPEGLAEEKKEKD